VWCGEVALDLRELTFTTPHPLRPLAVEQRLAVCARYEPDLRRYKERERRSRS